MKIHVVHDNQGSIRSLTVPEPDYNDLVEVVPNTGEQVSIVERSDNLQGEELYRHLGDLYNRYRIDVRSGRLVRK
jgi:hypothetical protein